MIINLSNFFGQVCPFVERVTRCLFGLCFYCIDLALGLMQVVIDFAASWCGPCRVIAPFLAELARKLPDVIFLKVDVDELKVILHKSLCSVFDAEVERLGFDG